MPGFPLMPPGHQGTVLVPLPEDHEEFEAIEDEVFIIFSFFNFIFSCFYFFVLFKDAKYDRRP